MLLTPVTLFLDGVKPPFPSPPNAKKFSKKQLKLRPILGSVGKFETKRVLGAAFS